MTGERYLPTLNPGDGAAYVDSEPRDCLNMQQVDDLSDFRTQVQLKEQFCARGGV